MDRSKTILSFKSLTVRLSWFSGRWGICFYAMGGPWGFHLYLDICQAQFAIEIEPDGSIQAIG